MNSREAFERAVKHFPRWMDIRKRSKKADGGLYLKSFTDELDGINEAIEDYRQSFFAYNYIGKENEVVDYLYVGNVGDLLVSEISAVSPSYKVTADVKEFNQSAEPMICFYDGTFIVKPEHMLTDRIEYKKGDFYYSVTMTFTHIWNVFDEFALYAGIERHEGERNKELLERSLLMFARRTNSTEWGLTNTILNELSNITDIKPSDVKIERLNNDNINKTTPDGMPLSEKIIGIDSDVYRAKKWDKNLWMHLFKKLEYAPHKWDEKLPLIQTGVGYNDSLKSLLLSELEDRESTDVDIDIYEMSDVRIDEYIRNNRLEVDIDLEFTKFGNTLKTTDIEYKITAEDVYDVSNDTMYIDSYKTSIGETEMNVQDLVIPSSESESIKVPGGKLKEGKKYKVRFKPKEEYGTMEIERADFRKSGAVNSLLSPEGNFEMIGGILKNTLVKFNGRTISDYRRTENMVNSRGGGITALDGSSETFAEVDLTGIGNQYLKCEFDCKETNIIANRELVKHTGFSMANGKLISIEKEGEIIIDVTASQLYYELETGNCTVTRTIDGVEQPTEIWFSNKYEHLKFDSPKRIQVVIRKMSNNNQLVLSAVRYAHFEVELSLSKGKLINTAMGQIIPSSSGQTFLWIKTKTFSGFSPVIKHTHIGSSLKNSVYETIEIDTDGDSYLEIDSNCDVELVEITSSGEVIEKDYRTNTHYLNNTNSPIYIKIDVSQFVDIVSSVPAIEKFAYQGVYDNWIKLLPGEKLESVKIEGEVLALLERKRVLDILKSNDSDKVYASKRLKSFVVKNGNKEYLKKIERKDLHPEADTFKIIGSNPVLNASFVIDSYNNNEIISKTSGNFEYIYMYPSNAKEYIAYNRERLIKQEVSDINIVDVFHPAIPKNKLVVMEISPVRGFANAMVLFTKEEPATWSLGQKQITIKLDLSLDISDNFSSESKTIKKKFVLSNSIDLEQDQEVDGNVIDIAEYILTVPEGMQITYQNQSDLPEVFYVEEDGFNKLGFANISSIKSITREDGSTVGPEKYRLLGPEGIISWADDSMVGEEITIEYTHNVPKYLTFTDFRKLYNMIGYTVETLKNTYSISYLGISDNIELQTEEIEAVNKSSLIIASSSNPRIKVSVQEGVIHLDKIVDDDRIIVKSGYFYDGGNEYYHYTNRNDTTEEKIEDVILHDVVRMNDELIFSQASTNFVPASNMLSDEMREVCEIDLVDSVKVDGVSPFNSLAACDIYNKWSLFEMDMSVDKGLNSNGTRFTPIRKDAFAIMEITDYVKAGQILSLYAKEDIKVFLAEEEKNGKHSFNKSIFAKKTSAFKAEGDLRYIKIDNEMISDKRLFLLIEGSGVIDDLIAHDESTSIQEVHRKNIDKMGFAIEEHVGKGYVQTLLFDKNNAIMKQSEVTSEEIVRTSTSVDWGYTKLKEFKGEWDSFLISNADLLKGSYIRSNDRVGAIESAPIYIRNISNAKNVIIKINELLKEDMTGFGIKVLMSNTIDSNYKLVAAATNTNTISVPKTRIQMYMKLLIELPPRKVINNIEVYLEYVESSKSLSVNSFTEGTFITKLYDSGHDKNYRIKAINFKEDSSPNHSEFYVRGLRQNAEDGVWTDWKEIVIDADGNIRNIVEFEQYQYFQFKINLLSEAARLNIESFEMEVVE